MITSRSYLAWTWKAGMTIRCFATTYQLMTKMKNIDQLIRHINFRDTVAIIRSIVLTELCNTFIENIVT